MTYAPFEQKRAHLSHYVLRSGLLNRLSSPPDLWSDERLPVADRALRLTDNWKATITRPQSVLFAQRAWREPVDGHADAPSAIRGLVEAARTLSIVQTTDEFPDDATIEKWLSDIDVVIRRIGSPEVSWSRDELTLFWAGLLALSDFLAGIQVGGRHFWKYFR